MNPFQPAIYQNNLWNVFCFSLDSYIKNPTIYFYGRLFEISAELHLLNKLYCDEFSYFTSSYELSLGVLVDLNDSIDGILNMNPKELCSIVAEMELLKKAISNKSENTSIFHKKQAI